MICWPPLGLGGYGGIAPPPGSACDLASKDEAKLVTWECNDKKPVYGRPGMRTVSIGIWTLSGDHGDAGMIV